MLVVLIVYTFIGHYDLSWGDVFSVLLFLPIGIRGAYITSIGHHLIFYRWKQVFVNLLLNTRVSGLYWITSMYNKAVNGLNTNTATVSYKRWHNDQQIPTLTQIQPQFRIIDYMVISKYEHLHKQFTHN